MTRKFVHLTLLVLSLFLASCSMFDSDTSTNANEIEGESTNLGDDSISEGDVEDFGDLDLEEAAKPEAVSDASGASDDSFGDIENFNEGLIENELSDEDMGSKTAQQTPAAGGTTDELDIESANIEESPVQEATPQPIVVAPTQDESLISSGNKITNLEYKSYDAGGTVVITAEKPFVYQVREEPQYNQTIIEVGDVELPERFKLPYIAKDFGQAVATVNAYQDRGSSTARFVIQYKAKMKPSIQQSQNSLLVMNDNKGGAPQPSQNFLADASFDATAVPSEQLKSDSATEKSNIAGKKITVEFYGTDIKSVIQYIADEVGVNLIIDDDASGVVNVRLRNVEWEEGLSQILNAHGLGYERRGQILRIAKTEKMTREIRESQERIKAEADNDKLTLPKVMKIIPINYGELASLERQIAPLLDNSEKVTSDARSNSLVITGYPATIKRAEQLVKSLDVEPLQVMIEGKIIEANSEFGKEFGIRWTSSTTFDVGGSDGTLSSIVQSDKNPAQALGGLITDLTLGSVDVLGDLTALLSIFEREQKIKILSSPKITVLNKETAKISQLSKVPLINSTAQANVGGALIAQTIELKDVKLKLDVTPQISFNSDMILDIKVDRDVAGTALAGGTIPVNERHAETKIRVRDGQSAVLGGIFNMDERMVEVGIPYLREIPVLGYLFKTKRRELSKNELVVFLYPKILKPLSSLSGTDLSRSGESMSAPSTSESLDKEFESL